jgi:hypothetical protein
MDESSPIVVPERLFRPEDKFHEGFPKLDFREIITLALAVSRY